MKQATLCLLIKPARNASHSDAGGDGKILLAMKKRGFGVGKWNGVGGKVEAGEEIIDAAIRETKEEIGVDIINPEKVGVLRFRFPYKQDWNQDVYLFLAKEWKGEPVETEEMSPRWFLLSEIPYDKMWDDDKLWLPIILDNKKIEADFIFKEGEIIDKYSIEVV